MYAALIMTIRYSVYGGQSLVLRLVLRVRVSEEVGVRLNGERWHRAGGTSSPEPEP